MSRYNRADYERMHNSGPSTLYDTNGNVRHDYRAQRINRVMDDINTYGRGDPQVRRDVEALARDSRDWKKNSLHDY
jgi:hypothetical protein